LCDITAALEETGLRGCSKFDRDLVETTSSSAAVASTLKRATVAGFFIVPEVMLHLKEAKIIIRGLESNCGFTMQIEFTTSKIDGVSYSTITGLRNT